MGDSEQATSHLIMAEKSARPLGPFFTHIAFSARYIPSAATTAMGWAEFLDQFLGFFLINCVVLVQIAFLKGVLHTFQQLVFCDLAILIGVKAHQFLDKAAAGSARTTWPVLVRPIETTMARTTRSATLSESTVLRATESATLSAPTSPLSGESALVRSTKRRRPTGHQFIRGQLPVIVSVQFLQ